MQITSPSYRQEELQVRRLSPAQIRSIADTGTFEIQSPLYELAYVWRLSKFLVRGLQDRLKRYGGGRVQALEWLVLAPSGAHVFGTVKRAVRMIARNFKELVAIAVGLRCVRMVCQDKDF